jgi:AsmA-like protein
MRGELPDMGWDGFACKSIKLKGDIQNGLLLRHEVVIEGDIMNVVRQGEVNLVDNKINLTILIAPFKTIDYIVSKIPLVSNILAGTLITIPINVTGNLSDPTVPPFLPKRSESGVLGIMKRMLELPFEAIQPVIPGEKRKEHQRGK